MTLWKSCVAAVTAALISACGSQDPNEEIFGWLEDHFRTPESALATYYGVTEEDIKQRNYQAFLDAHSIWPPQVKQIRIRANQLNDDFQEFAQPGQLENWHKAAFGCLIDWTLEEFSERELYYASMGIAARQDPDLPIAHKVVGRVQEIAEEQGEKKGEQILAEVVEVAEAVENKIYSFNYSAEDDLCWLQATLGYAKNDELEDNLRDRIRELQAIGTE